MYYIGICTSMLVVSSDPCSLRLHDLLPNWLCLRNSKQWYKYASTNFQAATIHKGSPWPYWQHINVAIP